MVEVIKRQKDYEHIAVSPSTFASFRNLKRDIEEKIGTKISDDNLTKRLITNYKEGKK